MSELRKAIDEMRKLWPETTWSKMKDPLGYARYLRDGDESHAHPDDLDLIAESITKQPPEGG